MAVRVSRVLRKWDADWAVNAAKRLGVKERFGKAGRAQPMTAQTRERLRRGFETELDTLEQLLGVPLDVWR